MFYLVFWKPFSIRNLKSPGKSGSARLPRGMKLGSVRHLVLSLWWYPDPCITARSFDPARFNALASYALFDMLQSRSKRTFFRLQAVQNAAARVVTLTPKHVHITPILINLH